MKFWNKIGYALAGADAMGAFVGALAGSMTVMLWCVAFGAATWLLTDLRLGDKPNG